MRIDSFIKNLLLRVTCRFFLFLFLKLCFFLNEKYLFYNNILDTNDGY